MIANLTSEALFAALAEREDRCELVDGEIVTVSLAGFVHGQVVSQIAFLLKLHLRQTGGDAVVIAGDPGFIWDPRNVRAPDVAVVTRADAANAPAAGFIPFAPLLAVEVVSPSDRWHDVHQKAQGWLAHGARSVWVVDPADRFMVIHRPGLLRELRGADTIADDPALPGFACPLVEVFRV
jgi:Uma2 family endonuclease